VARCVASGRNGITDRLGHQENGIGIGIGTDMDTDGMGKWHGIGCLSSWRGLRKLT